MNMDINTGNYGNSPIPVSGKADALAATWKDISVATLNINGGIGRSDVGR